MKVQEVRTLAEKALAVNKGLRRVILTGESIAPYIHPKKRNAAILATLMFCLPLIAFAHQPRLVNSDTTAVAAPEVSKAYYGKLTGKPQHFDITSDKPFQLYANLLVPDVIGAKKDVSAAVLKAGDPDNPFVVLGGPAGEWNKFHEDFGGDDYFQSIEFRQEMPAGSYEIRVWSSQDDSPFVLAVGEKEEFPPSEIWNALKIMPKIKTDFFGKPGYTAYLTRFVLPLWLAPIVLIIGIAAAAIVIKKRKKKHETPHPPGV